MKTRTLLAAVLLCGATAPALAAQQTPADTTPSATQSRARTEAAPANVTTLPVAVLDRPVSRTQYPLGPGDVLGIALFGELSEQFEVTVTPEGTVVVPGVGVTSVLGLNLDEAQTRVRALVERIYRNIEVRVTLIQVRSFKVFLVGDVAEPGVRLANAATRVSELVPTLIGEEVQRRNVTLRRADGDTVRLDLVRFRQTGDVRDNPTLRQGDAVVVPVVDETVEVFGRVAFPGRYEYRTGESLASFLEVVNGSSGFPADAANTIRVSRFGAGGEREVLVFSHAEATGARGRALTLRPFDAVFVPAIAEYRVQRTAAVNGQVRFPGTYPIRPDTTTVRDLVEMAGGFTAEASLLNATLRRAPSRGDERLPEFLAAPDSALTRQEREIRAIAQQARDQSFVVIDFQRLFAAGGDAYDQPLQAGDSLSIPRRRNEITVSGAVVRPGIVTHIPGATFRQYIMLAGGFSRRADRGDVSLIRAGQGNRVDARDNYSPRPGDQIIVPFRERPTFTQRVQAVGAIAGTITSTIVAVVALTRFFE